MDIRTRLFTVFMGIAFSFTAMLVFEHVLESRRMAFEAAEVKAEAVADLVTGLSLQNIETGEPGRLKELRPLIARFRQIIYLQVQDVKGHTLFMYANPGIKLEGRTSDVSVDKVADGVFDMERDLMSNNRSYGRLKLGVETGPVRKIVENVFWRAGFMGACFLTVFALVFWAASSRLAGDMRLLTEAAGKINDAELPALPAAAASSDIGKLSTAFREYHDTIAEERGLRKETEELGHDFFAMTVHDLKQPITVLKAANDLILEAIEGGAGSKKDLGQMSYLAKDSLARLNGMVEDILNITKLSDRSIPVQKEQILLGSFIKECDAEHSLVVTASGRKWALEPAPGIQDCCIYGDDVLIRRVIGNLVLNAVHYTREGGEIRFGVRLKGEDTVELYVRDNGAGIPEKFRKEIFSKYKSLSKTAKNVGLGLAFCRLVAERHSAALSVNSEEGKGTEIAFAMPVAKGTRPD